MKWWFKIVMALVALVILYTSFAMASLDRVIDDETFGRLRKIDINFINSKGEEYCYKLPESNVLPNNIFYPIKEIRDGLWVSLSKDEISRLRVLLLIRDKKIEEILLLQKNGANQNIIKRQIEKIKKISDRLAYEYEILDKKRSESKELQRQVEIANEFYNFIYEKILDKEKIKECYE